MHTDLNSTSSAKGLHIGIAISRYHSEITQSMQNGAEDTFLRAGGDREHLTIVPAPGSFELVVICWALAMMNNADATPAYNAVVALGCIITGQTTHDQYIAAAVAQGLVNITVQSGVPVAFGVLTCQNMAQARVRAGLAEEPEKPTSNKGAEAMIAAIEAANAVRQIQRLVGSTR
jgi:6,7-dimethyl-8-ribityllumazine synthase